MSDTTALGIPFPESTDDPDVPTDMQALAAFIDTLLNLPDEVTASRTGPDTISTTTVSVDLPGPVACSITNPSSDLDLICDVSYGARMASSTAVGLNVWVSAGGGLTTGEVASGGAINRGENLYVTNCDFNQRFATYPVRIPAGASTVTFTVNAYRDTASGAQQVANATLRVTPRRFAIPL